MQANVVKTAFNLFVQKVKYIILIRANLKNQK